jgi:tetratricopeptide (TPR) repeat protein
MGGFKPKRLPFGGRDGDDGASDSVSELSAGSSSTLHTNSTDVSMSKSRVSPLRILRAGTKFAGKMKGSSHSGGSDSTKATDSNSAHAANAPPSSVGVDVDTSEVSVGSAARTNLMKNAKSRFNIGIVYLKTGDYDKAQENLEKSLSCHMQLSGQDVKSYSRDTLLAIAGVHEKLGDCFTANSVVSDKRLALNHYDDARKLLCIVETEDSDAPEHIQMKEMLERVNEQLKLLLPNSMQEGSPRRPVANVNKYEMKANDKAKALLGFGALANAVRITVTPPMPAETKKPCLIGKGIKKIHHGIHEFANDIKEGMLERTGSHELLSDTDAQSFTRAISFLDRNDHRTAFNYLKSMQAENSMINPDFRAKIESALMTVASSALKAGKNGVATDAYEDLHTLLMHGVEFDDYQ